MKIFFYVFAMLIAVSMAFKRPDWYPKNGIEIENACKAKICPNEDILNKLRKLQIEDNDKTRQLIMCCLKNTNVYRPGNGPEADRIGVAFEQSLRLHCEADLIAGCIQTFKDTTNEYEQFFNVIKCIYDVAPEKCKPE
ncbi:uncharacterized protein LOC142219723 [Haematobia irritans]|uniref:uncharacterized protein LOC142219723 n=1 Tax=Haematobia irritans TaxID=7368 RepID=UPI003F4F6C27